MRSKSEIKVLVWLQPLPGLWEWQVVIGLWLHHSRHCLPLSVSVPSSEEDTVVFQATPASVTSYGC